MRLPIMSRKNRMAELDKKEDWGYAGNLRCSSAKSWHGDLETKKCRKTKRKDRELSLWAPTSPTWCVERNVYRLQGRPQKAISSRPAPVGTDVSGDLAIQNFDKIMLNSVPAQEILQEFYTDSTRWSTIWRRKEPKPWRLRSPSTYTRLMESFLATRPQPF